MRRRAAVLLASGAACLAGCGGHAVTKQDVIARANAICETAFRASQAVPTPSAAALSGEDPKALSAYLAQLLPIATSQVKQLQALPRPAQDRALFDSYVAALRGSAQAFDALLAAARSGDRSAIAAGEAQLNPSQAPALAERYGLTQCAGSVGSASTG